MCSDYIAAERLHRCRASVQRLHRCRAIASLQGYSIALWAELYIPICVTNVRLLMLTLMLVHVVFDVCSPLCVRASLEFPSCLCIHAMHAYIRLRLPCYAQLAMNSLILFATLAVQRSSSTILSVRAIGTFAISVLKVSSDVYGGTSWIGGVSIHFLLSCHTDPT